MVWTIFLKYKDSKTTIGTNIPGLKKVLITLMTDSIRLRLPIWWSTIVWWKNSTARTRSFGLKYMPKYKRTSMSFIPATSSTCSWRIIKNQTSTSVPKWRTNSSNWCKEGMGIDCIIYSLDHHDIQIVTDVKKYVEKEKIGGDKEDHYMRTKRLPSANISWFWATFGKPTLKTLFLPAMNCWPKTPLENTYKSKTI